MAINMYHNDSQNEPAMVQHTVHLGRALMHHRYLLMCIA